MTTFTTDVLGQNKCQTLMDERNQTLSSYIYKVDFIEKLEIGNLSKIACVWNGSCLVMVVRVFSSMGLHEKEICKCVCVDFSHPNDDIKHCY